MMRLICVFAGSKLNMFDFSHSGSNIKIAEGSNDVSIIIRYKTKIIFFSEFYRHVYKHFTRLSKSTYESIFCIHQTLYFSILS